MCGIDLREKKHCFIEGPTRQTIFLEQCYQLVSVQSRTIPDASDLSEQEENPLSFIITTEKSENQRIYDNKFIRLKNTTALFCSLFERYLIKFTESNKLGFIERPIWAAMCRQSGKTCISKLCGIDLRGKTLIYRGTYMITQFPRTVIIIN